MPDSGDFRTSDMTFDEAERYAENILGEKTRDSVMWDTYALHPEVKGWVEDHAFRDRIDVTEFKGGVIIEITLDDEIVNPNKIPGMSPRFWIKPVDTMNIFFEEQEIAYLLKVNL